MMNMWLKKEISILIFVFSWLSVFGQLEDKLDLPEVHVLKSGPYVGVQRGNYWVGELGAEFQWKKIRLKSALTHGVHTGFNYNFNYHILGYDLGYWVKPSRFGLTYGGNLLLRTDFSVNKFGFAPCVGYKIFGFHLQTGYQFLTRPKDLQGVNNFFLSLRFVLINHRDTKIKR
jgi:hypothetical protein